MTTMTFCVSTDLALPEAKLTVLLNQKKQKSDNPILVLKNMYTVNSYPVLVTNITIH